MPWKRGGPLFLRVLRCCDSFLDVFQRREGAAVEEALLDVPADFWWERRAFPETAAEADGLGMPPHGFQPLLCVAVGHALKGLLDKLEGDGFEVAVLPFFCIRVV